MRKTGLLIIATNKYISFLSDLLNSADEYFLPNENVEYFVFTNQEAIEIESKRKINLVKSKFSDFNLTTSKWAIFLLVSNKNI